MTNLETTPKTIFPAIATIEDFPSAEIDPAQEKSVFQEQTRDHWETVEAIELRGKVVKGCILTMIRDRLLREHENPLLAEKEIRQTFKEREVSQKESENLMELYRIANWIREEELLSPKEIFSLFTVKSLSYLAKVDNLEVIRQAVTSAKTANNGNLSWILRFTKEAKIDQSDLPEEIRALLEPGIVAKTALADFVDILEKVPEEDKMEALKMATSANEEGVLDSKELKKIGKNTQALQEIRDCFAQLFSDDQSRETLDLDFILNEVQTTDGLDPVDLASFLKTLVKSRSAIANQAIKIKTIATKSQQLFFDTGSGSNIRKILALLDGVIIPRERDDKAIINFPLNDEGTEEVSLTVTSKK